MHNKNAMIIMFLLLALLMPASVEAQQECTIQTGKTVVPLVGFYKCEILRTRQEKTINIEKFGWTQCGDDEHTTACQYTIYSPKKETWFVGLLTKDVRLKYKECNADWSGCTSDQFINQVQNIPEGAVVFTKQYQRGKRVFFAYEVQEPFAQFDTLTTGIIKIQQTWDAYHLTRTSPTAGTAEVNASGCFLSDQRICKSGTACDDGTASRLGELDFGTAVNYLETFAESPAGLDFQVQDHPRLGKIYCAGNGAYELATLEVQNTCYKYPGTLKAAQQLGTDFECCNGQKSSNAVCENFKWVATASAELKCDFGIFQCPNQGNIFADVTDPNRKTLIQYSCENKVCKANKFTSECASTEACPTGEVCQISGTAGKCVKQASVPTLPTRTETIEGIKGVPGLKLEALAKTFIGALIIAAIIFFAIWMLSVLPTPLMGIFSPIRGILRGGRIIIFIIVLALVFTFMFFDFAASIAASVIK